MSLPVEKLGGTLSPINSQRKLSSARKLQFKKLNFRGEKTSTSLTRSGRPRGRCGYIGPDGSLGLVSKLVPRSRAWWILYCFQYCFNDQSLAHRFSLSFFDFGSCLCSVLDIFHVFCIQILNTFFVFCCCRFS